MLKERREFITSFKRKLDAVKTFEEKKVLIDEFRQNQQTYLKRRIPASRTNHLSAYDLSRPTPYKAPGSSDRFREVSGLPLKNRF